MRQNTNDTTMCLMYYSTSKLCMWQRWHFLNNLLTPTRVNQHKIFSKASKTARMTSMGDVFIQNSKFTTLFLLVFFQLCWDHNWGWAVQVELNFEQFCKVMSKNIEKDITSLIVFNLITNGWKSSNLWNVLFHVVHSKRANRF